MLALVTWPVTVCTSLLQTVDMDLQYFPVPPSSRRRSSPMLAPMVEQCTCSQRPVHLGGIFEGHGRWEKRGSWKICAADWWLCFHYVESMTGSSAANLANGEWVWAVWWGICAWRQTPAQMGLCAGRPHKCAQCLARKWGLCHCYHCGWGGEFLIEESGLCVTYAYFY